MARGIVLLHGGSLGDFILSLGLLHRIRAAAQEAELCVVARCPMSAMPADRLGLRALLDADRVALHRLFADDQPLADELAGCLANAELVIDMLSAGRADFAHRLATTTSARIVSVDCGPAERCTDHIIEQWARCLNSQGIEAGPSDGTDPLSRFGQASLEQLRRRLRQRCDPTANGPPDKPVVMLHPGSGGRAKCWPIERFSELARRLSADGVQPVFLLGPTELDWHGDSWPQRLRPIGPVLVESSLWEAACLMGGADLYVGNDAGSTHLAAAAGTPTLALFGPTDPRVWRPVGAAVHVLAPGGAPTSNMSWLSVEDVHAACARLLAVGPTCG